MRKHILLLLGLVLIGTIGLAAGIEASKGNWEYHKVLRKFATPRGVQGLKPTSVAVGSVSSSALPGCLQAQTETSPLVLVLFKGEEGQPSMVIGEATCVMTGANGKPEPKKIPLFFMIYPKKNEAPQEKQQKPLPQPPTAFSQFVFKEAMVKSYAS